jgi:hypothetical protein
MIFVVGNDVRIMGFGRLRGLRLMLRSRRMMSVG